MLKRFVLGGAILAAVLTVASLAGGLGRGATASVQLDPEEQAFMVLLNDYRGQNGLGPISIDSSIQAASEWMSTDMGEQDYFSHIDSLGRSPWDRMCDSGYCYNTWKGENVAAGYVTAEAAFNAWQDSPGHNSNMLGENYLVMGIALVYTPGSTYGYYWTNDFGGYQAEPSPPPAPTNTPSPTPSPAPTATPSPTEMPSPAFARADVNCDEEVTATDALALLRYVGGLTVETPPGCPAIGEGSGGVRPASGGPALQGDVDCNSVVDAADARSVLLSASDVEQPPDCDT